MGEPNRRGSWVRVRLLEALSCIDCRRPLPKGSHAWRNLRGSNQYARRLCDTCLERRVALGARDG